MLVAEAYSSLVAAVDIDVDCLAGAVLEEDAAGVELVKSWEAGSSSSQQHHSDL